MNSGRRRVAPDVARRVAAIPRDALRSGRSAADLRIAAAAADELEAALYTALEHPLSPALRRRCNRIIRLLTKPIKNSNRGVHQ